MKLAEQRHPNKLAPIMMSEEDEKLRTDVMRRNEMVQLKLKHMQNFRRKLVDQVLKEREKIPGYLEQHMKSMSNMPNGKMLK